MCKNKLVLNEFILFLCKNGNLLLGKKYNHKVSLKYLEIVGNQDSRKT